MMQTRRRFISGLSAAGVLAGTKIGEVQAQSSGPLHNLKQRILDLFSTLPGRRALYILSPARGQDFEVMLNADTPLFCGSAFKAFVLLEFLRMVDAGEASLTDLLALDSSVWSLSSPVLTPLPGTVSGQINARTALDAMISRSDNTATDMLLKRVGAQRVRKFLASIGSNARIPDSTRQFFGYIFGTPEWQTIGWEQLLALSQADIFTPNPVLNGVQTMAATSRDFVSFYSRALQGEFFKNPGVLTTFRAVLAQAEAIPLSMPLGVNAFVKGGSIDFNGEHALCLAGGIFIPASRWAYFAMTINWTDREGGTVADQGPQFGAVATQIFTWLNERLGSC
jgi:beta-lactamase class A